MHMEDTLATTSVTLLRPHRERPRCRTAEQRYERATLHSITSSAMASSAGGRVRPRMHPKITATALAKPHRMCFD